MARCGWLALTTSLQPKYFACIIVLEEGLRLSYRIVSAKAVLAITRKSLADSPLSSVFLPEGK